MSGPTELFSIFFIQLFIIVDPLTVIPILLAITPRKTTSERRMVARRSCMIAFSVIVFFLVAGAPLIDYFGITNSAVRICGGILLFIISLELLYGKASGTEISNREERLAGLKEDVSVTPLAIPLLAGPGAIATTLVFADQTNGTATYLALVAGAATVFTCTYLVLHWSEELVRLIGPLGMKIVTRIMGLLLAFIAVQYIIDGIAAALRGKQL